MTPFSRPLLRAIALVTLPPLLSLGLAWSAFGIAERAATEAEAAHAELAAVRRQLEPQDGAIGSGAAPARLLVQGETIGVTGAAFQSLLTDLGTLSGAILERVDPVLAEPAGPLTQMHIRATFTGTDIDIMNLLVNLEAAEPLVFIDQLELTPLQASGEGLRADLDLSAFAGTEATP